MEKRVLSFLSFLLCVFSAHAYSWEGESVDPSEYEGIGFVLYATVENPNATPTDPALVPEHYYVAAFIDGKLRGTVGRPEIGEDGTKYFAIRVYGNPEDNDKPITIRIFDHNGTGQLRDDDMEYQLVETLAYADGGTLGNPSTPYKLYLTPCTSLEYPTDFVLRKGEERKIDVKTTPENCTPVVLDIRPRETDAVTISEDNVILARDYGEAYFTVNGNTQLSVKVVNPLKDIVVSQEGLQLYVGDTGKVSDLITLVGEDPDDTEHIGASIAYTIGSETIISISNDQYTALAKGETSITFTVTDQIYGTVISKEILFTVLQPLKGLVGGSATFYVDVDTDHNLSEYYTATPADADEPVKVTAVDFDGIDPREEFVPDEDRCVLIAADGSITVQKAGTAKFLLTPAHHDGTGIEAYVDFRVEQPVTGFEIFEYEKYVSYGQKIMLSDCYALYPRRYTVANPVTVTSSNTDVIELEGDDALRAIGNGSSEITLSTVQIPTGEVITASFTIYVTMEVTGFSIEGLGSDLHLWLPNGEPSYLVLKSEPKDSQYDPALVTINGCATLSDDRYLTVQPDLIGASYLEVIYNTPTPVKTVFFVHSGQKYNLRKGWAWLTSPLAESTNSLQEIFGDKLVEIRTRRAVLANDPEWGYFGDVENFLADHFKVKMGESIGEKIVFGASVNDADEYTVTAQAGWTWLPNYFQHQISLAEANKIWGDPFRNGAIIKSKDNGFAMYDEYEWTGDLTLLDPGEAYMLYCETETRMTYPMAESIVYNTAERAAVREQKPASGCWQYDHTRFMDNMAMIARITNLDAAEQERMSIGVFVGDECRGEGRLVNGLWFITAHGQGGDAFTLRLSDRESGMTAQLGGTYEFTPLMGSATAPVEMTASSFAGIDAVEIDYEGVRLYDLCGNEVTGRSGSLAPGVYVAAKNGAAKKVIIK